MTDPHQVYLQLSSLLSTDNVLLDIHDKTNGKKLATVKGVATSNGCCASQPSLENPSDVEDFIFLTHEISLSPTSFDRDIDEVDFPWPGNDARIPIHYWISRYTVSVQQVTGFEAISPSMKFGPALISPKLLGMKVIRTCPFTTVNSQSATSGWTETLNYNAGFFGDTLTGGVTVGKTLSNSVTQSYPDVQINNRSVDAIASYDFNITDRSLSSKATLEFTLTHVFQGPDPVQFASAARSGAPGDYLTAPVFAFKITIEAETKAILDHDVHGFPDSDLSSASTSFITYVRVPPLTKATKLDKA